MKNNKFYLPVFLILSGIIIGIIGALFKIQKYENASIILLISVVIVFTGLILFIIRKQNK